MNTILLQVNNQPALNLLYEMQTLNLVKVLKEYPLINDDDDITPEENRYLLRLAHERENDKKVSREKIMAILDV